MRALKWTGITLLVLIIVLATLAFIFRERLVRLNAVNTLFSEELIVSNFSNMDKAFYTVPIPASGDVETWEKKERVLPVEFTAFGETFKTQDWLSDTATTSLIVIQEGTIVFEDYFLGTSAEDLRVSWSVAKSVLSAAFGVAVEEGKIDLEAEVQTYVPELSESAYNGATVRNVLNMASGVRFNEDYLDFWSDINKMGRVLAIGGSMDDFAADVSEREREPGSVRQYVSIDTHILAWILRNVTGKTIPEYVAEKIISPIGFERTPYYLSDSQGNAFALGGLNMTTRDYARFGQMILDGGAWQEKQIVPKSWIVESTAPSAPKPNMDDGFDYGYQWWVPIESSDYGNDFLARGIYGQFIYVNPKTRTVIVRTAANRGFRQDLGNGIVPAQIHVSMFREIAKGTSN